ncbi:hypothetical protein NLG97_g8168 [Lecanicillium saksenae]|uniref:Uncharacterized protein n=1 Tax=Lecanicillium saksenae TaxID=468837 RepID=A0ACC1QJT0_9HYPO|nr:hypothetical protein NLG97_g8168 [Lecanicillium saksenae]
MASNTKHELVSVKFFTTGTVQLRPSMKSQPIENKFALLRQIRALADSGWSEELPIAAFIISHPDGPILFDTGESPLWNDTGYVRSWYPTRRLIKVNIQPGDCILAQLRNAGLDPTDLQAIVLSHLHGDHAGGLGPLVFAAPNVPIYISREHWEKFGKRPFWASLNGCNPQHWPKPFSPIILDYTDGAVGPWQSSCNITSDGKVVAVDTSGHVPGHLSLIVAGDNADGTQATYFLAADATYSLDQLNAEHPDGINGDPQRALQTMKRIKSFAEAQDVVVLPSHDRETRSMLENKRVYKPKAL